MRSQMRRFASHIGFSRGTMRRMRRAGTRRANPRKLLAEPLEHRRLLAFDVLAEYSTASSTLALELALIDSDSRLDLVLIENNRVTIRPGNADGSFAGPLPSADEIFATRVIASDFDNDGITDLVTSYFTQFSLRIGNGDGTFQEPISLGLPELSESAITGTGFYFQNLDSIATGDLNADGKLDLVVGGSTLFPTGLSCGYYGCGYTYSNSGYVNVLLGTGTGSFTYADADPSDPHVNAHPLGIYQAANSLAVKDVNNDGQQDVVASKVYGGGMAALLGDGTGRLQSAIHSGSGTGFQTVLLGDLDGDGRVDTVSRIGNSLIVQKGQGDGSFVQGAVLNAGQKMDSAAVGDVNGDGKLDLVVAGRAPCTTYGYYGGCYDSTHTRQATVLVGDGQGGFSLPSTSILGVANATYADLRDVALVDLTGDSLLDLVTIDGGYDGAAIIAENDGFWTAPVELSITDVTIVEGDSGSANAVFTVNLTGDASGPVTVDFVVFDDYDFGGLSAARAGVDYTAQSGTLTFGPGVLSQTISVPVFGDRIGEGNETFHVNLSNPSGALLRDAEGVGTIADNEPTISINHPFGIDPLTVVEGDSGSTPAVFTVTLSRSYDQNVTVAYYTSTGHTSDIIPAAGTLQFLPGETSKNITVQVVGDLIDEPLEAFNVYLSSPSLNAFIINSGGYCYIEDNDPTPILSISDVSKNEGNSSTTTFAFTLTLSSPAGSGTYVEYATANGTATITDQDYSAKAGYVYFNTGATTATIIIDVKGDQTIEPNETFFVNLLGAGGASVGDAQGVGTILNDDGGSVSHSPKISISDASVTEGNSGSKQMTFTVSLSQASTSEVRVTYTTANGTAKTGNNDYVAKSATLRFAPGETSKQITITIKGDTKRESDEYFLVKLSKAVNGTIADGQGVGTILNDDGSTALSVRKRRR